MRLIYITQTLPYAWGKENFFIPEIEQLIRQGHSVLIVPRQLKGGLCREECDFLLANSACQPLLLSPAVLWCAFGMLMKNPWRTVCTIFLLLHASPETVLRSLAVLPKGLWIAKLALAWGATHIHSQWATTTSTMGLIASMVSGVQWSFTAHRGDIVQNELLAIKCKSARFVRFISKSGIRLATACCPDRLEGVFRVVHLGVSVPPTIAGTVNPNARRVILCPANMIPVKGHRYLVDAVSLLKERNIHCSLLLAGEGPLRGEIEAHVDLSGVADRVHFLGHLSHESLLGMYERGEVGIVALPSVDLGEGHHEGIPVSLMEAMAHAIPVVSTTTGGIPELIKEGDGLLVPPADPEALSVALAKLLNDQDMRTAVASAGRARVLREFCVETVARKLARLIGSGE